MLIAANVSAAPCTGELMIDQHVSQCDAGGKLVAWAPPEAPGSSAAYDFVLDLNQKYFLGLSAVALVKPSVQKPPFYAFSYLCSGTSPGCAPASTTVVWPHNPAGLYAMLAEAAQAFAPYKGDTRFRDVVLALVDWQLAHGLTAPTDHWASVAYASSEAGEGTYAGSNQLGSGRGDGVGYLQPDKVGAFGWAALQGFKLDGGSTYLGAAINAANQLAVHVRVPTSVVSPWPFRVKAADNSVRTGDAASDNFSPNVVDPLKLFTELIALGQQGALTGAPGYSATALANWQSAKSTALSWLLGSSGPIATGTWVNYFEDVDSTPTLTNLNNLVPGEVAKYLMDHPTDDPNWKVHVQTLIGFIESEFSDTLVFGARPIREQSTFAFKMGSHTSRYAAVNARYAELTGDATARDKAFRSFNWASYMVRNSGMTLDGPEVSNIWFTDGWADFVRNFMIGMAALPDYAPANQNHLLRSSSVVKQVSYASSTSLSYTTYDASSTEVLRLAFAPVTIIAGGVSLARRSVLDADGWTFDSSPDTFGDPRNVLRVRHSSSGSVSIQGSIATAAPWSPGHWITLLLASALAAIAGYCLRGRDQQGRA